MLSVGYFVIIILSYNIILSYHHQCPTLVVGLPIRDDKSRMVTDLTKTGGEDGGDVVESLKGGEELVAALSMIMTTTTVMMVVTAMMILMVMEVESLNWGSICLMYQHH